ncbi:type VI secretion system tip protein TssI/VgrG [Defluviimonas aestuarii]|uniref:type VI secretion system Vgr family protein n=1 Tax=Albidovulum aestuarii TaxID=1130726 RepID=UPI00249CEB5E|nr:type VI secretion system tip protein TssI/VgrG [Defluviimonas aestuarii]MDI3337741.1 type VI secretion system tip protein TssI/VgrG [Defluviimonas aestuarii]
MPDTRVISASVPAFGEDVSFARMEGFDEVSRPFHFDLSLVSKNLDLKAADVLGTRATIVVSGDPERHFDGFVSEFALADIRDDLAHYRLALVPWLWFLSLKTDNRIFQNQSVVDIVEAVFGDYPDADFEKRLTGSYPPRVYCVQYGESDLDFVQRLLEHEGIFYFFEHENGAHRLILADDSTTLTPAAGAETLPFEPDSRISFEDGDFITTWLPVSRVQPGGFAQTDYDFIKPSSDLMSKTENPVGHAQDASENYHYPGTYTELARGDTLSALRLEELQASQRRIAAAGTARPLWSGRAFTLDLFPREAENDDYIVLRVDYELWDAQFRSGQVPGDFGYSARFTVAPKAIAYRPPRVTPKPVMKGPQTAVVVGPAGEEIFTDEYARVKVQFHWDRLGAKDENTTCMIRVSQTWAGAGWGFIQIPRIGQEVIVDFLEGDPDQPIITGRVYNAEQMPPYALPGSASQSGWKSNSTPGGGGWNELRFEDKAGSEEVYFQAQKDHNELVKNDESRKIGRHFSEDVGVDATQSVGNDRTESVGNDKSTSVGNNRTVSIGSNDTETVGANRALSVGGDETISVGGNSTETIGANHSQTVGAIQTITVAAARIDSVGAAETRTVGAAQSQTVGLARSVSVGAVQSHSIGASDSWDIGASQSVSVGAGQTVSIGAGQTVSVGADQGVSVGGGQTTSVGGDRGLSISGNDGTDVGGDGSVKIGGKYVLDVGAEITLKCGGASIVMKSGGEISIKGTDVTVEGSGKINVKAGGDVKIKGSTVHNN